MSAVRNIFNDLVDRRLWPVALALLAALVAVPVMLGGGSSASSPASPDPLASAAASGGTAQAAISVSAPSTARHDRPGAVRNPFTQHKVKALSDTQTTAPPTQPTIPSSGVTITPPSTGGGVTGDPGYTVTPIVPGSGGGKRDTTVQ